MNIQIISAFIAAAIFDYFFPAPSITSDVIRAEPATIALVITAVAAATSAGVGIAGTVSAGKARRRQEGLVNERRAELLRESQTRLRARKRAETTGQRVGRGGGAGPVTASALGFGSGNVAPGLTRGTLFGN